MACTVWLVAANAVNLELRMEFFQLHHPLNVIVLCDRKGCEQVADYLEVDDHGHEYRVCAMHTDSKTHASRLPTRKPSPDLFEADLPLEALASPPHTATCRLRWQEHTDESAPDSV
jgi:hypothetical protein